MFSPPLQTSPPVCLSLCPSDRRKLGVIGCHLPCPHEHVEQASREERDASGDWAPGDPRDRAELRVSWMSFGNCVLGMAGAPKPLERSRRNTPGVVTMRPLDNHSCIMLDDAGCVFFWINLFESHMPSDITYSHQLRQ